MQSQSKTARKNERNRRETTIKISNNQKNSDLNYHKGLIHTNPTLVFKELMDDHATPNLVRHCTFLQMNQHRKTVKRLEKHFRF